MADTTQTIRNFYERAVQREFLRDINFRIISISLGDGETTFDENDLVYARGAKLPERQIENVQVKYQGMNFNLDGTVTYPNSESYTLKFYSDAECELRDKFETASRNVFDDATNTGNYFTPKQSSYITLAVLDKQLNAIKTIKLVGVSLRKYSLAEFKFDGKGDVIEIDATFSYHYYEDVD